jgi:dTDP-4-amino-4,6-dideoxygalactose transaminase
MSNAPDTNLFDLSEPLALHGGPKAKRTPFPQRKRHGELEKRYLCEVIDSDVLFYFIGTKVFEFQKRFAAMYGRKHCIACSSGTAAVHIALGALELPPGSEVITSAVTDMGSLTGMLYQGLVPVFADLDPGTLNMDPASARRCITPRTRAILVVHHSGLAADMDAYLELGREFNLPVVEDCAQAYGTSYKGRLVGTMGRISSFSLNHFKHINCGSGGMVITDDDRLRYLASLFLDKCYQREEKIRNPFFLAPNYQITELQGAVALAQLERVQDITARRNQLGTRLNELLRAIPGIIPQTIQPAACTATSSTFSSSTLRISTAPHASSRRRWRRKGCRMTRISSLAGGRCTSTTSSKSVPPSPAARFHLERGNIARATAQSQRTRSADGSR